MKPIEEIYWLRFYGCLAVFSFHLLDRLNQHHDNVYLDLLRIPTVVGTPTFIFMSTFLFSMRYASRIPDGFLSRRIVYVLVPYVAYGLIYSVGNSVGRKMEGGDSQLVNNLVEYLLFAGWHGYFLLIAVQFYFLYWLFVRFELERALPPGPWLIVGSLISAGYWCLGYWLAWEPPGYLSWIVPLGWIYVFFLALLLARHYPRLGQVKALRTLSHPGWLGACLVLLVVLTLPDWLEYSSKEPWVVPLFVIYILVMMRYLHGRPATPWVKKVNEYSFGIYLAHPLFFSLVDVANGWWDLGPLPYTLLMILIGLAGSVGLNMAANRFELGGLLFGKRLVIH